MTASLQEPVAGGRAVIARVRRALDLREEFVLETTLSGRFPIKTLRAARAAGYEIMLVYIGIDDPNECVRRVARRVREGGHHVPEADIRWRYVRSINALPAAVIYADRLMILSNATDAPYRQVVVVGEFPGHVSISPSVPRWAASAALAALRKAKS